jgi:hypothetical protein
MSRTPGFQRYQIVDEPRRPPLARVALPAVVLMPVTIYLALRFSLFFFLLPGVNGLLVAGNHKWRDVALSVLAVALMAGGIVTNGILYDAGVLRGLWLRYAEDAVLALATLPLLKVALDQFFTTEMRQALGQTR